MLQDPGQCGKHKTLGQSVLDACEHLETVCRKSRGVQAGNLICRDPETLRQLSENLQDFQGRLDPLKALNMFNTHLLDTQSEVCVCVCLFGGYQSYQQIYSRAA